MLGMVIYEQCFKHEEENRKIMILYPEMSFD